MDYNEHEAQRQRHGLRVVTDLIVFVAMVAMTGLCAGFITWWITGIEWLAQGVGYSVAFLAWLMLSLCWISDREDRAMGAK